MRRVGRRFDPWRTTSCVSCLVLNCGSLVMNAEDEYQRLLSDLAQYKDKTPPALTVVSFLRLAREQKSRDSENVALYGSQLLKHNRGVLSEEELWLVYEQVALAAMDCNATADIAAPLVVAVQQKFPDSMRARRLKGMYFEAAGHPARAEEVYKEILSEAPNNEAVAKRLISLEKTKGNITGAIDGLKKYLDLFMNDLEAWEELAELYLEKQFYRQAAYCYEEILLGNPMSLRINLRYADVLYTLGGAGNCRTARSYYAKAIELSQGTSARALYGFISSSMATTDKGNSSSSDRTSLQELQEYSAVALLSLYKQGAPNKVDLVTKFLHAQGIAA